jgi:hypothetical protein
MYEKWLNGLVVRHNRPAERDPIADGFVTSPHYRC